VIPTGSNVSTLQYCCMVIFQCILQYDRANGCKIHVFIWQHHKSGTGYQCAGVDFEFHALVTELPVQRVNNHPAFTDSQESWTTDNPTDDRCHTESVAAGSEPASDLAAADRSDRSNVDLFCDCLHAVYAPGNPVELKSRCWLL